MALTYSGRALRRLARRALRRWAAANNSVLRRCRQRKATSDRITMYEPAWRGRVEDDKRFNYAGQTFARFGRIVTGSFTPRGHSRARGPHQGCAVDCAGHERSGEQCEGHRSWLSTTTRSRAPSSRERSPSSPTWSRRRMASRRWRACRRWCSISPSSISRCRTSTVSTSSSACAPTPRSSTSPSSS